MISQFLDEDKDPLDFINDYSESIKNELHSVNILEEFAEFFEKRKPEFKDMIKEIKNEFLKEKKLIP